MLREMLYIQPYKLIILLDLLTQHQIIFPSGIILELNPRTNGLKIVHDHGHAFSKSYDVVVSGNKIKTLVINLTIK